MKVNALVLAVGNGGGDASINDYPICLMEFDGKALLERIVSTLNGFVSIDYTFSFKRGDIDKFHLDNVARLIAPGSRVVAMPKSTMGSACTSLLSVVDFPAEEEVIVLSANELLDMDIAAAVGSFRSRGLDCGLFTFRSFHPRYSYVRLNDLGYVTEVTQKNPISMHATTGVFWFRRAGDLTDAIMSMIRKDASVDGEFYIAPAINELVLGQCKIGVCHIDSSCYHPLKDASQINHFDQVS